MSDVFLRTLILNENAPAKLLTISKPATPVDTARTSSTNGSIKSAKPALGAVPPSSAKVQKSTASSKPITSGTPSSAAKIKSVANLSATLGSTALAQKKAAKLSAKQKSV
ncbi:hypothetical protein BC830DRAFT_1159765 [Chytriomyces sp. MP71]|nr:hypothetical protein BC830DRAFT_1159765 [Chytriomyces sp. MP71]